MARVGVGGMSGGDAGVCGVRAAVSMRYAEEVRKTIESSRVGTEGERLRDAIAYPLSCRLL